MAAMFAPEEEKKPPHLILSAAFFNFIESEFRRDLDPSDKQRDSSENICSNKIRKGIATPGFLENDRRGWVRTFYNAPDGASSR